MRGLQDSIHASHLTPRPVEPSLGLLSDPSPPLFRDTPPFPQARSPFRDPTCRLRPGNGRTGVKAVVLEVNMGENKLSLSLKPSYLKGLADADEDEDAGGRPNQTTAPEGGLDDIDLSGTASSLPVPHFGRT